MAPILGYWKLRSIGQPIRLLLAHVNQEYEEKNYVIRGPGPDYDRSDWLDKKFTLGLDFPNLPYYIDGDFKLSQSSAILRYLADKHDLNPTTEEQKRRTFEVEYQIDDFKSALSRVVYGADFENTIKVFVKTISGAVKLFSDFLGKEKWLAGQKLTYVDFMFYETLQWYELLKPGCIAEFGNIKDYVAHFEALPNISNYLKSDKFIKSPYFGPMAHVGNV